MPAHLSHRVLAVVAAMAVLVGVAFVGAAGLVTASPASAVPMAAGVGPGAGAGTVCTLDGLPAEGYPYCWTTGGLLVVLEGGELGRGVGLQP